MLLIVPFFFLLFIFIVSAIRIVQPNTARVVVRLGKQHKILYEGFKMVLPIFDTTITVPLQMTNTKMAVSGITSDNVSLTVAVNVITQVRKVDADIFKSVFAIDNAQKAIEASIEEHLRASIFAYNHEEIFGKRTELSNELQSLLEEKIKNYGMRLDSAQITSIDLDKKVLDAMNKVVEAEKLKKATITQAGGEKQRKILEAEADKEIKKLNGEGMAEQRKAITKGFKESISDLRKVDEALSAEFILQYILDINKQEVLENVGKGENVKVIYLNENLENTVRQGGDGGNAAKRAAEMIGDAVNGKQS